MVMWVWNGEELGHVDDCVASIGNGKLERREENDARRKKDRRESLGYRKAGERDRIDKPVIWTPFPFFMELNIRERERESSHDQPAWSSRSWEDA